jgi:hypothetical protein
MVVAALALSACDGAGRPPGDAVGTKVLRNLLETSVTGAKLLSVKKTDGREVKNSGGAAYEFLYEIEVQFPEGYQAKCAYEKERGACAYLGLDADQSFQKNELLKSEGTLHFVKTEKGWLGEDKNTY